MRCRVSTLNSAKNCLDIGVHLRQTPTATLEMLRYTPTSVQTTWLNTSSALRAHASFTQIPAQQKNALPELWQDVDL